MTEQSNAASQEEIDYRAWKKTAWDEVRQFHETAESEQVFFGENNPQHRLAPEFFQFYLGNMPSKDAKNALQTAFTMWSNLRGVSEQAQEALKHIPHKEDVWEGIGHCLLRIFNQDGRTDEGLVLLEKLAREVIPPRSRTALLSDFSRGLLNKGQIEKARRGFEKMLQLNASESHVKLAQGYIYELDHLNIGQPAPHFRLQDIDGNVIDLADHQGKVVVLHFWGTTCGACKSVYPHLREMVLEFPEDEFVLVGISDDQDSGELGASICEEKFTWPQICEGKGWEDTLFRLYNVNSIPAAYIIDKAGNIACKIVGGNRGKEIQEVIRSLVA